MRLFLVWIYRPYDDCERLAMIATTRDLAINRGADLQTMLNRDAEREAKHNAGEGGTIEILPAEPPAPELPGVVEAIARMSGLRPAPAGPRIRYQKKNNGGFGTILLDVGVRIEEVDSDAPLGFEL